MHQPIYLSNPSGAGGSQLSIAKHHQCFSGGPQFSIASQHQHFPGSQQLSNASHHQCFPVGTWYRDETMKSPSLMSTEDTAMKSPLVGADEISHAHARVIPHVIGRSSPSAPQPATAQTMMEGVRTEHHFIHHPYLDSLNLAVNAEFPSWSVNYVKKALLLPLDEHTWAKDQALAVLPGTTHESRGCRVSEALASYWGYKSGGDSRKKYWWKPPQGTGPQLKTVQVPTDHLVSPWLLTTHWHEWARWFRKPTEELRALVSPPRLSVPDEEQYKH
ncbi:hypothetical protein EDC04DRAFT_2613712 [Pisolithus marmoratus]|nr:hypothetical protein EDC04DRAFT_2613813 [Pisolithus marmoratus]KAI5992063.1 hypothetical protein EDC04DRAFT_2613712 [Pisolithus marmoratus]